MTFDEQNEQIVARMDAKLAPKELITDCAQIAKAGAKMRAKVDDGLPHARVRQKFPCLRVTLIRVGESYVLELYSRTDYITSEYANKWAQAIGAPDVSWRAMSGGFSLIAEWRSQL